MTPLRILIADDHDVVRIGIRALLERQPGYEVVGEAATGREAVAQAERLRPDVVVMDVSMPELDGFEATRQITSAHPELVVLVMTVHESDQVMREVLQAGARGYVLKSDAGSDLVAAIECLRTGKPFFTSKASNLVLDAYVQDAPRSSSTSRASPNKHLTPREREVLQRIAEGSSNKEIADLLGVRVKTVETHRANLMRKLELHSVVELVRYAIRNKLTQA